MNNVKIQLIAAVVRVVADNTDLIRRPEGVEAFVDSLINVESYDIRMARKIDAEATRVKTAVRNARTNRKFKKIVENV